MKWLPIFVFMLAAISVVTAGCRDRDTATDRKVAEDTEVKEKLFGGTEIEKKELIEKNGQYELREQETEIDDKGNVTEQKERVKKPDAADVNVDADETGVRVDIDARDRD
ncbi:MAG TPA: hypothetical protein PL151_07105 [Phycisphaerae bacterium]|nr:hypothetical protein [Phycisphaerae bacterium]HOJ74112.1 hypothetical protein [Phycisphaerae bacterium]HOM50706.1 hypothetical protein [Phycisphaerae bacterium]HON68552.1 hypothetical protein [Phycisphaerae bacterium]HOQ86817.1 hypothetical protein [Phycisphaerae bacterium]